MAIREELEKTGNWLFRWRSYLPAALIIVILPAINSAEYQSRGYTIYYDFAALLISLTGLALRCVVIGYKPKNTSGGNVRKQRAEVLNTKGLYSVVRHPLYLGNFIIWIGISLVFRTWWMTVLIGLIFWLYYERIVFAEEEFLRKKFKDSFMLWAAVTPAFFPAIRNWQPAELAFSWKKILGKEYAGFFAIIMNFTIIKILINLIKYQSLSLKSPWLIIFSTGLVIYSSLRFLKRCTGILDVPDR
jgi:protein-S-isoprenylcysteine O-methyltransferase Ste14